MRKEDYLVKNIEDTYLVWLAGINRYLQLKEPAFRVFMGWAEGKENRLTAEECAEIYSLPFVESQRFVNEITAAVGELWNKPASAPDLIKGNEGSSGENPFTSKLYRIGNSMVLFRYGEEPLQELIHPLLHHFEIPYHYHPSAVCFELFTDGEYLGFRCDRKEVKWFPYEEDGFFKGAVFMELINIIHDKDIHDWMGVFHASAVSRGGKSVIFTAPSGSGKSTLAALLMADGFRLLTDDFVPVALSEPEVYPFPSAVSVKPGGLPVLAPLYPSLAPLDDADGDKPVTGETYLPLRNENLELTGVKAKAIVFISYDPATDYSLEKRSNLEAMNDLLKESWIAATPVAARRFLDWYFDLPVYSLRYSDNEKMIRGIRELFGIR